MVVREKPRVVCRTLPSGEIASLGSEPGTGGFTERRRWERNSCCSRPLKKSRLTGKSSALIRLTETFRQASSSFSSTPPAPCRSTKRSSALFYLFQTQLLLQRSLLGIGRRYIRRRRTYMKRRRRAFNFFFLNPGRQMVLKQSCPPLAGTSALRIELETPLPLCVCVFPCIPVVFTRLIGA